VSVNTSVLLQTTGLLVLSRMLGAVYFVFRTPNGVLS
jgi:hypothetical protein